MRTRTANVLLVEDSEGDIRLTREALEETKSRVSLSVARDGEEVLAFLRRQPPYTNVARPDLIVMDLNLPKKDGREVLAELKSNETLKRIPVVVLTTSDAARDIFQSYGLHANCYITKPVDLAHFVDVVRQIENFWLRLVKLPSRLG